ncbi:hypothetical protein [Sulfitobacter sp.]|uniref:hypothetical protein n=1 Tax=Sulfitobacter sp. TaxID=1903071 RepID=UPI0030029714
MRNKIPTRWGLLPLAVASLTACTQPLTEGQAAALQTTTGQIEASLSLPATLQQDAHGAAFVTGNLCEYLAGNRAYGLGALPPALDIGPTANSRLSLARALKRYLNDLIDASRGDSLTQLQTSRDAFVVQAAALTGSPATVEPVLAATLVLLGRIGEAQRQDAIRGIMDGVADDISTLPVVLAGDEMAVLADVEAQIGRYEQAARCVLNVQRTDAAASEIFLAYDAEIRDLRAQAALIKAAPALVRSLRKIHIDIVDEKVSFVDGLSQLADVLEDINTITSPEN